MANLSITASEVLTVTDDDNTFVQGTAGGTLTAGMPMYLDSGDDTYKPADANVSAALAAVVAIALHGASASQPIRGQTAGTVKLGATAAPGTGILFMLSATAGAWAPCTDLTTGMFSTTLGTGIGSNNVKLGIHASGQQV